MRLALGVVYKESQWDMTAHWMYTWAKKTGDVGTVLDMPVSYTHLTLPTNREV